MCPQISLGPLISPVNITRNFNLQISLMKTLTLECSHHHSQVITAGGYQYRLVRQAIP